MRPYLAAIFLVALSLPAAAQRAQFLDDRSSAQQVVASYFNALQMRQFARAYSYRLRAVADVGQDELDRTYAAFRADMQPVTDLRYRLGEGFGDAGAGTYMTAFAVVTQATYPDGSITVESGCILVKQVSPDAQDLVPFQPIRIAQITMHTTHDRFNDAKMAPCRNTTPDQGGSP
ncbi:hypothetical protein ERN12_16875 [Rhodobacteraceae bacterium]|nr:hypothetical protein ERN12_16875 [Paracoccaceae bacterium]